MKKSVKSAIKRNFEVPKPKNTIMEDFTIAIYCFIDDLVKRISSKPAHHNRKLVDSQVITLLIVSSKYFYGNQTSAASYLKDYQGFNIPDKSNLNRHIHSLSDLMATLFSTFGSIFKELNLESVYLIDSFPVPVCRNIRISRSKIVKGAEYRGYNASKREYFYGFKVHVITTGTGIPVEFLVTPGVRHDNAAFQMMDVNLPANSDLYADAAYLHEEFKELHLLFDQIRLKAATKSNTIVKNTWMEELENKYFRKTIENTFADISAKLPKKIHAVTAKGFLIKILVYMIMICLEKAATL